MKGMLEEFGVYLKPAAFKQDVKPLLKDSCSAVFGSATGLTDMLVQHMPLSRVGTAAKVRVCQLVQGVQGTGCHTDPPVALLCELVACCIRRC